jgi:integrase
VPNLCPDTAGLPPLNRRSLHVTLSLGDGVTVASIINRSQFSVRVENHPALTRHFTFDKKGEALAYLKEVRNAGHKGVLDQGQDQLLVRIRERGYEDINFTATSYEEAEKAVKRIESEREAGLFIDYTRAHKTTLAKLFEQYVKEECPRHKGGDIETYTLKGFIADSNNELTEAIAERDRLVALGKPAPRIRACRIPRRGLKWLHKPLARVVPKDIEGYIHDRIEQEISPSTVDRELDLISQVITWARKTLRIHIEPSPLYGVRRPKYFNERDRRLQAHLQEEQHLLAAAREEDRLNSLDRAVELRIVDARAQAASLPNASARKRHIAQARREAINTIGKNFPITPWYEALLTFLLETTARRSEALELQRSHLALGAQTAFFPDTKNGRSRNVPLRSTLVQMLRRLPVTDDERVFPISLHALKGAWYRICERAGLEDLHLHDLRLASPDVVYEEIF